VRRNRAERRTACRRWIRSQRSRDRGSLDAWHDDHDDHDDHDKFDDHDVHDVHNVHDDNDRGSVGGEPDDIASFEPNHDHRAGDDQYHHDVLHHHHHDLGSGFALG